MEQDKKIEALRFIIGRYDSYFISVNSKGSLLMAVNTFILGSAIAGYHSLDNVYCFSGGIQFLFILTLTCNILSIVFTALAIKTYMTKKTPSDPSMIYFKDVAYRSANDYYDSWEGFEVVDYIKDLKSQAYHLAKGLTKKFVRLNIATWFLLAQFLTIIIFGIYLLFNH